MTNESVVDVPDATKLVMNCCQKSVLGVQPLFVAENIGVVLAPLYTLTLLVVPKMPLGSQIFPTQNDRL